MALPLLAIGLGALGVMGANAGQKNEDRQAAESARSYGIKVAGINFTADRVATSLVQQVSTIAEAKIRSDIAVDKAQAQAESDAKVSAAAAGVAGQSVDAVVNDTERTAAEAKGSISEQARAETLQIQTDYTDNFLNAHMSKGNVNFQTASKSDRIKSGVLGFAQGFLGGL